MRLFERRKSYFVSRNIAPTVQMDGGPMAGHVVIAPDRFKGSLTAAEAAHAIALGLKRADPTLTTVQCPVADGGDGTLGTVLAAGFQQIPIYATGPTGQVVRTA